MGSIVSGIGNLFGGGSGAGSANNNAGTISALASNAGQQQQLGSQLTSQGNQIFGPAYNQFSAGAAGQLTPAEQALVTENLGTSNTATEGLYGGLGLGGSTMEGQDLNANALRSLSETANLASQEETLGLTGMTNALGYYGGGESALAGSNQGLTEAGGLQDFNTASLDQAINSLGNKSAGGLGSGVQSLIGSTSAGTGLAGLFGGGATGAGAAATGGDIAGTVAGLGGTADLGGVGLGLGAADAAGAGAGLSFADALPLLALA